MSLRRRGAAGAAGLLAAVALAACESSPAPPPTPARPAPVALTTKTTDLPGVVHVGVIVSLQVSPGQGGAWTSAASGAQVAAYRYQLGKQRLQLDVVNDHGTSAGAVAAVAKLTGDHVSGIVAATEGNHLDAALASAATDKTAVLLPYDALAADDLPSTTWLTGPSQEQVAAAVTALAKQQKFANPVVISDGDRALPGVSTRKQVYFGATTATATFVQQLKSTAAAQRNDAVIVDLPSEAAAKAVAAMQAADVRLPVVLTRDALSPQFGQQLQAAGGSLSDQLLSVGDDTGDVTSLAGGTNGGRAAAFLSAVGAASRSGQAGLFGSGSFTSTAGAADVPSHDAVVSIAAAAAKARSADAAKVLAALSDLSVSAGDGLAGPTLSFASHTALADSSVVGLAATSQSPGARPAPAGDLPKLFWFPVPKAQDN